MIRDPELNDAYTSLRRAYELTRETKDLDPLTVNIVSALLLTLRALDKLTHTQ